MTSAPDRRRTSMVMTASIGSVPLAIGTKTFGAFEAIVIVVVGEERVKEKRFLLLKRGLSLGVKFVRG